MKTVTLRTGAEEPDATVKVVYSSLRAMMDPNPEHNTRPGDFLALFDLASKCRNRDYQFFGNNEALLVERGLVQPGGRIHDSVRNVVLASVEGEGMEMRLVNPVTGE
jgi:hypothetical protein